ncbi:helix-turn-helix domain-containing protein [Roseospira goensis]|uniref:HTH cro/C1-type domain-containing protein n=1 Tax=Roseospira goensis TaxID=391922 RepID=A0A7W6S0W1_9PROT|nr:helix-turn-helix transcriptional regulator [Roseospira goensis]MBB4286823.1 hypothetical protein [Roseospira goensis]
MSEPCPICGGETRAEVLPEYADDLLGLPVVLRNAVVRETCTACGATTTEIPDLDGLTAALAVTRGLYPLQLTGAELRFLRKATGMNARDFADAIDLDTASLSRWENDKQTLGGYAEKVMRVFVCEALHDQAPAIPYAAGMIARLKLRPHGSMPPFRPVMDRVRFRMEREDTARLRWETEPVAA